jgi:hypothetical protein
VDGVSFDKSKIDTIIGTHITDATKKGKLIEHLKKLADSEGIDKTSDDTVLSSFFKKDPKKVIETIIAHELEDPTFKASIVKEMKDYKSADDKQKLDEDVYFTDDEPSEAGIAKFLYEKKMGKNHSLKDITTEETPDTPTNGDTPK